MINMDKSKKKIKKRLNESDKMIDSFKREIGCPNTERIKLPLEFKDLGDYEVYCQEFINKYSDKITEYANEILLLNNKTEKGNELILMLMGFSAYLVLEEAKKNGLID